MEKQCPRCGKTIECRHDDIENCWCMHVTIEPAVMDFIADNYQSCLCAECFDELNRAARLRRPLRKEP